MDLTTQNHFVELGKAIAEKEYQEKNFQENYKKLAEDFEDLEKQEIKLYDNFYSVYNQVADYLETKDDSYDISALAFYLLIKNQMIKDKDSEINFLKQSQEIQSDQIAEAYKEIEVYEERIKKAKTIVQRKNSQIEEYTQNLQANQQTFTWLYLFLFLSLGFNVTFLTLWNSNDFYESILKLSLVLGIQALFNFDFKIW